MSKEPSLDSELPLFDDYPLDGAAAAETPSATTEAPVADRSAAAELLAPAAEHTVPAERPLSLFPDPQSSKEPDDDEDAAAADAVLARDAVLAGDAVSAGDGESTGPADPGVMVTSATGRRAVQGPAALSDRLYSGLLDLLANGTALTATLLGVKAMGVDPLPHAWQAWALLTAVFSYLYWVVPLAFWGQTPGMTWRRLIARNADREPLTFGQASRRWLGALLTVALLGTPLLLALGGRSLSDRLSNSQSLTLDG